jgi:hypothetical protein
MRAATDLALVAPTHAEAKLGQPPLCGQGPNGPAFLGNQGAPTDDATPALRARADPVFQEWPESAGPRPYRDQGRCGQRARNQNDSPARKEPAYIGAPDATPPPRSLGPRPPATTTDRYDETPEFGRRE